jgi:hypothetical protein
MKEDNLLHKETAAHDSLIDDRRPCVFGLVTQIRIKRQIGAFGAQSGGVERSW